MIDGRKPVRPLFIRVEPHAEESLISVLVRACDANVLGRLDRFKSIAGFRNSKVEYVPFAGIEHVDVIAGLLDVHPNVVLERMHHPHEDDEGDCIDWYGTRLRRRWIEKRVMRFSPDSLTVDGHHKAIWSVKPLTYCPVTMEMLVSTCCRCRREATWATATSTTRCSWCGEPFDECATVSVPAELREEARLVADLVSPDATLRMRAAEKLPRPFSGWEPGDAFAAAVELGYIANNPRVPPGCHRWRTMSRGCFDGYSIGDLVAGYRFVRDWPESLQRHLTNLAKTRCGTQPLMGTMGKYFGQHASASPLGDLLRQQVPVLLRKIDAPLRGNQLGGDKIPRSKGTLTASEMAEAIKIDNKVVARLSVSTTCCVAKSALRSGVVLYRRTAVEKAVQVWRETLTFDQAARELGVPPYCAEALVDADLLAEITNPDVLLLSEGRRLISRASLNLLARRLDEMPLAQVDAAAAVPFLSAMTGILHPTSWTRIVRCILNGQIKLAGRRERTWPILGRFLVAEQTLEKLKAEDEVMPVPEVTVSGMLAADMLGVSNTLVSGAVRLGLVQGKKTRRRIEVPLTEVRRYQREFIGANEVAKKTGVRAQDFSAAMRSYGFEPIGQAYNTYFWRRADAEELYPSQL